MLLHISTNYLFNGKQIKYHGLKNNLRFTATTNKNGTQVKCSDTIDTNSMTCTIMISGMPLTVLYLTNMYYHYKVLQVMLLQEYSYRTRFDKLFH